MHDHIDTFTSGGQPCSYGCPLEETKHWIELAHKLNRRKRIVAVKHWSWWDLEVTEEELKEYQLSGDQPAYLYAESVISDSSGQFQPGNWVRTSPLQMLHDDVLFETRNSIYVMVGSGNRKQVSAAFILSVRP